MNIREVAGNYGTQGLFDKKKNAKKAEETGKSSDRIELSPKAKELQKAQNDQRIEEISQRIDSDFYSQREVLDKIATNLLKDLQK
jgi:hypothetical protein